MPCYQSTNLPSGFTTTGLTSYATEAECNQACQEGACCEGTTCAVKPACQCQGAGKVFKGAGTTCASVSCGCCCVNGVADATKNEQQCAASGGTWKSYSCDSPSPPSILLTLSISDYDDFDFQCIRGVHTLTRGGYPAGVGAGYESVSNAAGIGFQVTTTGSWSSGYTNATCGCAAPRIRNGIIGCNPLAVVKSNSGGAVQCFPSTGYTLGTWVPFWMVPNGASGSADAYEIAVPSLCTGQVSVSGTVRKWPVMGLDAGDVIGSFTLGNPLP